MKTRAYNGSALAALAASLFFSLGTAHADNRFGDGVGGAMGGTGSFGEGSVTIHHNLLPEEREEIDDDIGELNKEIDALRALLAQQKAEFDAKLEAQKQQGVSVGQTRCKFGNSTYYAVGSKRQPYCGNNEDGRTATCSWVMGGGAGGPVINAAWVGGGCFYGGGGG